MKTKKESIACGTDFSPLAAEAATVAALLAASLGETLVLVHVRESDGQSARPPEMAESFLASLRETLRNEPERLRRLGAVVKEELLTGSPYETLIEVGQRYSARLVVVSSRGRTASSRFLVGSVAERTAEHSSIPTLVVRSAKPFAAWRRKERPLNVVLGYDFSSRSDDALSWIRGLRQMGPCAITAVYADFPPQEAQRLGSRDITFLSNNPSDVQVLLERDLKQRVVAVLGEENVRVRVMPCWGQLDEPLLQIARETKADLVVVGTHKRRGLNRLRLGSVSRAVLHHASESIAVVPRHSANAEHTGHLPELKRVLVATDLTGLGDCAIP